MNILPITSAEPACCPKPAFKHLTVLPAARESVGKEFSHMYKGSKSAAKLYEKLESAKINALKYLQLKPEKGTEELADMNVILHNIYFDKKWDTITYLYSMPDISSGLRTLTTKESIFKNPVEVFKQAMTQQSADIHYKYNLPYELW